MLYKRISYLMLSAVLAFSFPAYSARADIEKNEMQEAVKMAAAPSRKKIFAEEISNINNRIRITSAAEAPASAEFRALYTDASGKIKSILIMYTGSEYGKDIVLIINGITHTVTSEPDSIGYIYESLEDENITADDAMEVRLSFGESVETITAKPVMITESADEWITSPDGHSLYYYMGSNADIVVPNFYDNKPITVVGGAVNSDDEYENIMEKNSFKGIKSVTISEGIRTVSFYAFSGTAVSKISFNSDLKNICGGAFSECSALTSPIALPSDLEYLGDYAFYECVNLKGGVTLPGSIGSVGEAVFYNCHSMQGPLVLEEGITDIGFLAFGSSTSSTGFTSVSLPSTLREIGPYAFQFCTHISTIMLPEGLEVISDGAFDHMTGITDEKMVIPSTVHTIGGDYLRDANGDFKDENTGYGGHIFYDLGKNESFRAFEVAEGNDCFTAVDGVLYSADMTRMLAYPRGKQDKIFEMPEGITQIDEMAFSRAYYLDEVVLPNSYVLSETVPENILNQDANSLSAALYVYTTVKSVNVKADNPNYISVDGLLYSKDKKSLWYIPTKHSGDVVIQEGTERLERGCVFTAAKNTTGWGNIIIPSTVSYIESTVIEYINYYHKGSAVLEDNAYYVVDEDGTLALFGDVNNDLVLSKDDAALILKYLGGFDIKDLVFNKNAADFNKNGKIDLIDVVNMLKNI